jgi:hypothetical protein
MNAIIRLSPNCALLRIPGLNFSKSKEAKFQKAISPPYSFVLQPILNGLKGEPIRKAFIFQELGRIIQDAARKKKSFEGTLGALM